MLPGPHLQVQDAGVQEVVDHVLQQQELCGALRNNKSWQQQVFDTEHSKLSAPLVFRFCFPR